MKKVSLDTWIQLLGRIGLLGGLVFVGAELRQSQRIAIAAQVQARSDAGMAFLTAPLEGNFQAAILNQENPELKNVTDTEDRKLLEQIIAWRITSLNNAWQQHVFGFLPEATFEQVSRRSLVMFERCEERALFDRWATVDFIAYLKTRSVAECDDSGG